MFIFFNYYGKAFLRFWFQTKKKNKIAHNDLTAARSPLNTIFVFHDFASFIIAHGPRVNRRLDFNGEEILTWLIIRKQMVYKTEIRKRQSFSSTLEVSIYFAER